MMWADEFDAWNLLADPSWRNAFQSLNNGADSGPPFFYAVGRSLLAITGLHPVVVRLYSAFCFWLAAVVWVQILRRHFNTVIAVAAVVVAFLCNLEILDQSAQIRFYGELVLATALAVRIFLWLEETRPSTLVWFVSSAVAGLILVVSHPLGLVYSAGIIFAQMFTRTPVRKRIAAAAGTFLSWTELLLFFLPVKHAAQTDTWLTMPNAAAVVHFYDNHPLLLVHFRYLSVALNLGLLALAVHACIWFIRNRRWKTAEPDSFALLIYISIVLTLMPIGFAIVSHLYKPLFLGRYLLPYGLGLITLAATGAWLLIRRFVEQFPGRSAALLSVPLVLLAYFTFAEQSRDPESNLIAVLQVAQSMPTVFQNDEIVRQARFYAPARATNLFYVMLTPKPDEHATLYSIAEQGYEPALVFDAAFFSQHRQFLYIDGPWQPIVFNEDLRENPAWRSERVGTARIRGITCPILKFTRVDDSAATTGDFR